MPTLAQVRRTHPAAASYVRGTFPVPEGYNGPLHLKDSRGASLPTQITPYLFGPSGAVRAVELVALGSVPGGAQTFSVEAGAGPSAAGLTAAPSIVIGATDHRGVVYSAAVAGKGTWPAGTVRGVGERAGPLKATGGASDFLHFKAQTTRFAGEDFTLLDLIVHNGCVEGPLNGDVYFDSLRLSIPTGYVVSSAIPAPWLDPNGTLIRANADGKLHVMLQRQTLKFRLAIHKPGDARAISFLKVEGFAVPVPGAGLWSWNTLGGYFNQGGTMPNHANEPASIWDNVPHGFHPNSLLNALQSGTAAPGNGNPVAAGPYHPFFDSYGNGGSGQGILQYDGLGALHSGRVDKIHELFALDKMNADRHRCGMFNLDGSVVRVEDKPAGWKVAASPGVMWNGQEGFNNWKGASQWRRDQVYAAGKSPTYEGYLRAFENYDFAHLARYTSTLFALAWLLNDWHAKQDIDLQGEWARMWAFETGSGSLVSWEQFSLAHPAHGIDSGVREIGWAMAAVGARYMLSTDPRRRERFAVWADKMVGMTQRAQVPSGGIQGVSHSSGQKPASNWPGYRIRQSIEDDIYFGGLRGLFVAFGDSRIPPMLVKHALGQCTFHAKSGMGFPLWQNAVAADDVKQPAYTSPIAVAPVPLSIDNGQTGTALSNALLVEPGNATLIAAANQTVGNWTPTKEAHSRSALYAWKQGAVPVDPGTRPPPTRPPPTDPPPTRPPPTGTRPPPTTTEPPRTDTGSRLRLVRWTRAIWDRFMATRAGQ